jgi:putative transposase
MPQSMASVHLHIVFSTKHREPLIEPAWSDRLYAYLGGLARERDSTLLLAGGRPDHVQLLVNFGRSHSIRDFLRDIKSHSSSWVKQELGSSFSWQSGYAAFSVSQSNLDDVLAYIRHQDEHHRTRTFQEEVRLFLQKNGLAWDERYLWD